MRPPKLHIVIILLLLLCNLRTNGQLCNGSLGDPVVFIDFGNSTPEPLPGDITTYTYRSASCPNDGFYTIAPVSGNCFGSSWHNMLSDHTPGDQNGNMMIINASEEPGDFLAYPVTGLCSNTAYEFSAFVANIHVLNSGCGGSTVYPDISFTIETPAGDILGTYSTGAIPQSSVLEWKQYGFYFTTPPGNNTIVIRMKNKSRGGCGNDLVLDDISFRPCGPKVDALFANITGAKIEVCQENVKPVAIGATTGGFASPAWQWQWQISLDTGKSWTDIAGEITPNITINPTAPQQYIYRMSAAEQENIINKTCRVASNPLTVTVNPTPVPAITIAPLICEGKPWQLSASDGVTWAWSGPGGFSSSEQNPTFTAAQSQNGTYSVNIKSIHGCTGKDQISVIVHPSPAATIGDAQTICAGTTVKLSGGGNGTYTWSSSSGTVPQPVATPFVTPADTTFYDLIVTNSAGCSDRATTAVYVNQLPVAHAGPDLSLFAGDSIRPIASFKGNAVQINWTPPLSIAAPHTTTPVFFLRKPQTTGWRLFRTLVAAVQQTT